MIQTLDSDFWTSHGAELQLGNGSCIVSYFVVDVDDVDGDDDDDDDNVKTKMLPGIVRATETISRSFRKYISNIPGKNESNEVQKKNSHIGHFTHM